MERVSKVSVWLGAATSAIALLAFFGIENFEQLKQVLADDSTPEQHQTVNAGDCLHNWMIGKSTWATKKPVVVACGTDAAAVQVSRVLDSADGCPTDGARHHLSYTSDEGKTVVLCLTRKFEVGQCILALPDGGAQLMSWVECGGGVPAPYSHTYIVTGVYAAPARHTPGECDRSRKDSTRYSSWFVDDKSVLVCAVVYDK